MIDNKRFKIGDMLRSEIFGRTEYSIVVDIRIKTYSNPYGKLCFIHSCTSEGLSRRFALNSKRGFFEVVISEVKT
jgi:hypothetical protein